MKKWLALLLACLMLFAVTACNNNSGGDDGGTTEPERTAYEIYTEANERITEAGSAHMKMDMSMNASYGEETLEIAIDSDVKQIIHSETDVELEMAMNMSMMGQEIPTTAFYKDGVYYIEAQGIKQKMEMPVDEALKQSNTELVSFPDSAIKDQSVESTSNGSKLSFTLDGQAMNDMISGMTDDLTAALGDTGSMEIEDIVMTANVDADGNLLDTDMDFTYTVSAGGESIPMNITIFLEVLQIGDVTITYPEDLDSYMESTV